MKEDFLHYLWKFQKFPHSNLITSNGETLAIINPGQYLQLAGPDFFNAQLIIGNQKWAGNVEIHVRSSDWYLHQHENDCAYENVILHVVWENDAAVFRKDNSEIPVLELQGLVSDEVLKSYQNLLRPKTWIYCEKQLSEIDDFVIRGWIESLFFERLEQKARPVSELLKQTNFDWEAVLFCLLAKNFGLNTNGTAFFKMATSIPFSVIRKESFELDNLEALFYGFTGLLSSEKEHCYFLDLKFRFNYLFYKHRLDQNFAEPVEFFKHRPDNFPTIRLSQLAGLYHARTNLFSDIIEANTVQSIYSLFNVGASEYWETHYLFDKESKKKRKLLTKAFIDLLIINTIVPVKFVYAKSQGQEISERLFEILYALSPELNSVTEKFSSFGLKSLNAFDSQALLQLKKEYCDKSKCLSCAFGIELLKNN